MPTSLSRSSMSSPTPRSSPVPDPSPPGAPTGLADLTDQAARDRIETDLGTTLFVEAGAGSGKTTALVNRVVALVTSGTEQLEAIAAITFTEKAGAELRDRIRRRLEECAEHGADEVGARCRTALDQLDGAAIGTLHAFAQRLLTELPIEAGLPPKVEVLDEISSAAQFERRWSAFRDELLGDPAVERSLLLLFAAGVKSEALRSLAQAFNANWDLVIDRVPATSPEPLNVAELLEQALLDLEKICDERHGCGDPEDGLCRTLGHFAHHVDRLRSLDDEVELVEALGADAEPRLPSFRVGNSGNKKKWGFDLTDLRAAVKAVGEDFESARNTVATACACRLGSELRRFTIAAAQDRRRAGQLEFHDLLVLARSLLRHPDHGASVRTHLHQRYRRLLLDEFQDTDPIQIELAVRIAAAHPASTAAGEAPWPEVEVAPGRLFVVGDPKQSIYRFRRADIAVFLQARDRFGGDAGEAVALTTNFRAGQPLIQWTNHTFGRLLAEPPDTDIEVPSQSPYVALGSRRPAPPAGPPIAVLGRSSHPADARADVIRGHEAAEVADAVGRAIHEGWMVDDGAGGWRPARLGDVAILVPARTSLPFLEDALEAAGVPYRAESSSLVYATRAVRDVMMVLRAVDDPGDHLSIVSALRTPLFGCGDDDLFRFKVDRRGRWNYLADQPDSVPSEDPVAAGLAALAALHRQRIWRAPSELLDSIVRDRRAMELGFVEGRPRDVWRRLRFVIDQARAWSEATGGSLREYLSWVDQQTSEGARVAEAVLPETDDDAVRIMTIHAAKGLEFPITIVSGLSTAPQSRGAPGEAHFPPSGGVAYRFGRHVSTPEYEEWKPIDEQMAFDERVRLLYVATTRACDHLVVSLHHKVRKSPPDPNRRTNAELLISGMADLLDTLPDGAAGAPLDSDTGDAGSITTGVQHVEPPPPFDEWEAERRAALTVASRPGAVAATALTEEGTPDGRHELVIAGASPPGTNGVQADAPGDRTTVSRPVGERVEDPGLKKRPRDLDLPPWLKGRYGTAVGRAVHGVLQTIDLASGQGLDDAVAAQCEAEAIPDRADDVRRLVHHALDAPSVREAAGLPHWREVYACTPIDGGRLLEGYVDLLYRTAAGLVVIDHKTAATSDPEELDRRVQGYRFQGAAYALAAGAATGEEVVRVTFVFLTPNGAVERDLDDLPQAIADVRARVMAGEEVVV